MALLCVMALELHRVLWVLPPRKPKAQKKSVSEDVMDPSLKSLSLFSSPHKT